MNAPLHEICGAEIDEGVYCLRPPHEDDEHQFDIALPPIVNKMIAEYADTLEATVKSAQKYERRARWGWRVAVLAAGLNLGVVLFNVGHYYWGIW